jgi:hypothetical protein
MSETRSHLRHAKTDAGDIKFRLMSRANEEMTVDQQAAIALFEGLGFKAEALLRDHVQGHQVLINVTPPADLGANHEPHRLRIKRSQP